ncbi:MAG: DUF3298 domain-containing protein [Longibaculum sp.]
MKFYLKSISLFLICSLLLFSLQNVYATCPVQLIVEKDYHLESSGTSTHVTIPKINGVKDAQVTKKVNQMIQETVEHYLQQAKQYDHQANHSQDKKWLIDINYQTYDVDCHFISFSINSTQINASSYLQKTFFNIDLKNGQILTVEDFIGKDYQKIIKDEIQKQVKEDQKNQQFIYFDDAIENLKITKQQPFYINKEKQVVVVFNEFEIAPGYMGMPEFIIS